MIRCQHCGEDIEEGKQFCPYCGEATGSEVVESHQVPIGSETSLQASTEQASAEPGERYATAGEVAVSHAAPMSGFERSQAEGNASRRMIYIAVAAVSAVLVVLLAWMAMQPAATTADPQLEGAIRPGSPEFESIRERLIVEFNPDEHATEAPRPLGDIVMTLTPTLRNFTGRTIDSVELRASVLDLSDQPIKSRTVVRQINLEPNKVAQVPINLEGFKSTDVRANAKVELTGVKFK